MARENSPGQASRRRRAARGGPHIKPRALKVRENDGNDDWLANYGYGNYIDEVMFMRRDLLDANGDRGTDGTPEDYYFLRDDQYSVTAMVDEHGTVLERVSYDPFGRAVFHQLATTHTAAGTSMVSAFGNPFAYTGRRLDGETGLYYFRHRYYDPASGRFTTRDPIGDWGDGINLGNGYAFLGSGFANGLDPMGLFSDQALMKLECSPSTSSGSPDSWLL